MEAGLSESLESTPSLDHTNAGLVYARTNPTKRIPHLLDAFWSQTSRLEVPGNDNNKLSRLLCLLTSRGTDYAYRYFPLMLRSQVSIFDITSFGPFLYIIKIKFKKQNIKYKVY